MGHVHLYLLLEGTHFPGGKLRPRAGGQVGGQEHVISDPEPLLHPMVKKNVIEFSRKLWVMFLWEKKAPNSDFCLKEKLCIFDQYVPGITWADGNCCIDTS